MEGRIHRMEPNGPNRFQKDVDFTNAVRKESKEVAEIYTSCTLSVLRGSFNFTEDDLKYFKAKLKQTLQARRPY
jgi:hypothetical protein